MNQYKNRPNEAIIIWLANSEDNYFTSYSKIIT